MNIQSRENEDTLQELEKIRNICSNALEKVDTLLATQFNPTTIDYPLDKEKLLEDVTFISHSLSTAMNMTDPLFRHYFVIPSKTEDENLPFYLMTRKNDSLIKYEKKFIILGNVNALSYKETFALIKENKLWLGYSIHSGDREFGVPDSYPLNAAGCRTDENGKKYIRVKGVRWFTNIDYNERHEELVLYKNYSPEEYPKYENYDAINVDVSTDIPMDYDGVIGVPITFLDKYSPDQFEIVGLGIVGSCEFTNERRMEILDKNGVPTGKYTVNAKGTLYRKHLESDKKPAAFKDCETGELYQSIYARILIKRKQ